MSHHVSQILTPQAVHELFDFNYDTVDPEGKKALAAERRVREAAQAAAAAAAAEAQGAAEAKREAEQAAVEAKAEPQGEHKAKGKDKARQEKEDAMDLDEPAQAGPSAVGVPPAQRPKKRSAELAGLDSTPVPATRTTRKSVAAALEPPRPPVASKKSKADPSPKGPNAERTVERATSGCVPQPTSPNKPMPEVLADEEIDSKTLFTLFESGCVKRVVEQHDQEVEH